MIRIRGIMKILLMMCILCALSGCASGQAADGEEYRDNEAACGISFETWEEKKDDLPLSVFGGEWDTSHCQGIAIDDTLEYLYFSFTTKLVKVEISSGEIVGTVSGW